MRSCTAWEGGALKLSQLVTHKPPQRGVRVCKRTSVAWQDQNHSGLAALPSFSCSLSSYLISFHCNALQLVLTGVAVALVDRWGRRPLLLTGVGGMVREQRPKGRPSQLLLGFCLRSSLEPHEQPIPQHMDKCVFPSWRVPLCFRCNGHKEVYSWKNQPISREIHAFIRSIRTVAWYGH